MMDFYQYTEPMQHQFRALKACNYAKYFGYFMEQGLGKTKTALDDMMSLYNKGLIEACVVIAPNGCIRQWTEDSEDGINKHISPDDLDRINYWLYNNSTSKRVANIKHAILNDYSENLELICINVEAVNTLKGKQFIEKVLLRYKTMLIIDESTTIKNHRAKRTKKIINFGGNAVYRRILAGTPAVNGPLDMFTQMKFLHSKILGNSFYKFKCRYAELGRIYVQGGKQRETILGYRREDELKRKIAPFCFIARKEDCLDLPAKIYQKIEFEMTQEQDAIYEMMKEQSIIWLEEHGAIARNVLARLLKLRQILCGYWTDDSGEIHQIKSSNRLALVKDLVERVEDQIIICSNFIPCIENMLTEFEKSFPGQAVGFYGAVNSDDREKNKRDFNTKKKRILIINPACGKYGLNIQNCSTMSFHDNSFDLDARIQIEDRIHGINRGKVNVAATYIDFIGYRANGKKTVDHKERECLIKKKKFSDTILGVAWKEWF